MNPDWIIATASTNYIPVAHFSVTPLVIPAFVQLPIFFAQIFGCLVCVRMGRAQHRITAALASVAGEEYEEKIWEREPKGAGGGCSR